MTIASENKTDILINTKYTGFNRLLEFPIKDLLLRCDRRALQKGKLEVFATIP